MTHVDDVARAVARGLAATPKRLPAWLFYDRRGSELFEQITELPEYYLTRAEREIFVDHGDAIVEAALAGGATTIVELGAGSAQKTELLLHAAARHGAIDYVPVDVSAAALEMARARLAAVAPAVRVTPWLGHHDVAFDRLRGRPGGKVVLFIGSSIGNFVDAEAVALLGRLRDALGRGDALLLGTDLRKDPAVMVAAYDDAAGVTAAFNLNVLVRINRELGGRFDPACFRHVAVWHAQASRIEMHLESDRDQVVAIADLGLRIGFREGERIHTESSVKYDDPMVDRLLSETGFGRERTWRDAAARFAVHLARAT
jgi:L-histidine Nalpha-methyltransferase